MSLKIVSAEWSPAVNLLWVVCDCGQLFRRRADRWRVRCLCGAWEHLSTLREAYVAEANAK